MLLSGALNFLLSTWGQHRLGASVALSVISGGGNIAIVQTKIGQRVRVTTQDWGHPADTQS